MQIADGRLQRGAGDERCLMLEPCARRRSRALEAWLRRSDPPVWPALHRSARPMAGWRYAPARHRLRRVQSERVGDAAIAVQQLGDRCLGHSWPWLRIATLSLTRWTSSKIWVE